MFKLWRKYYRAKETADRKASFEFQGRSDLKKGKTLDIPEKYPNSKDNDKVL